MGSLEVLFGLIVKLDPVLVGLQVELLLDFTVGILDHVEEPHVFLLDLDLLVVLQRVPWLTVLAPPASSLLLAADLHEDPLVLWWQAVVGRRVVVGP